MADELITLSPLATETIGKLQARVEALERALGLADKSLADLDGFFDKAGGSILCSSYFLRHIRQAREVARKLLEKK